MSSNINKLHEKLEILDDQTNGIVKISVTERLEGLRKTKIVNNFTGNTQISNSKDVEKVIHILNNKLNQGNEIIVGFCKSSIMLSYALAQLRQSSFCWSTPDKLKDWEKKPHFFESHRNDEIHIMYGLNKGDSVILIEDEIQSGKGIVECYKAMKKYGITVNSICSVIETLNFNGAEYIKSQTGLNLISLVKVKFTSLP